MPKTGIQLFTLAGMDEELPEIIRRVGETSFEAIEFNEWGEALVGADDSYLDEIEQAISESELEVGGALLMNDEINEQLVENGIHDQDAFESVLEFFQQAVPVYKRFDVEYFSIPLPREVGEVHFNSRDAVEKTANRLSELGSHLEDHGIHLLYHNHFEGDFIEVDGRPAIDILLDEVDDSVGLQVDTAWIQVGGGDPAEYITRYGGERVPSVHFKDADVDDKTDVEIDTGDVDIQDCVGASLDAGSEWLMYEYEWPDNPQESLEHGAETISSYVERS